jgi:hypothetical protein
VTLTATGLMDVIVRNTAIGQAEIVVDLGPTEGQLRLVVQHDTDRYRRVRLQWLDPIHRKWTDLGRGLLDTATGEMLDPSLQGGSDKLRNRPRHRPEVTAP